MSDFAMPKTCAECPWRRDVPVGKFQPERYRALQATCEPGGLHLVFACHMTPKGSERACAGFLIVHGIDNNLCRIAAIQGRWKPGEQVATAELYDSFDELAKANGYDPHHAD